MDIPYCFVRGKARLGQLVHQKNAAVLAITEVRKEDEADLTNLTTAFRATFNDNTQMRKEIGGFKRGAKSQIKFDKLTAEKEKEAIQKLQWSISKYNFLLIYLPIKPECSRRFKFIVWFIDLHNI